MMAAIALATTLASCAPQVAPSTMAAIVRIESGGDPLAIGDNTTGRSYHPGDRATAESIARRLLSSGHSVDLGIAQIDDVNLASYGLTVHTAFDPCANLNTGAQILTRDYARAEQRFGPGQAALRHAIGMYNTGQMNGGAGYIRNVLAAAGIHESYATVPVARMVKRPVARNLPPPKPARKRDLPATAPILVPASSATVVFSP